MKKLYTVYVHITPDGMHYYGVTNNPKRRWEGNGRLYKTTALQPYIEKFGWENIQHIVLFENQTKEDALSIEDSLIISGWEKGNCINQQRSGNISKEEGYFREYRREYREENREKYNEYHHEYQREYREKNREKYNEYHREYQREYQRQRYQRKKEEKQFKEFGYIPLF